MHFPYAYKSTEGYGTQRTSDGKVNIESPSNFFLSILALSKLILSPLSTYHFLEPMVLLGRRWRSLSTLEKQDS
jgi:hypothetical protein